MNIFFTSIRFFVLMSIVTGFVYPGLCTLGAKLLFPHQANGGFVKNTQGKVVGSEWIAQSFQSEKYFHPRPSAIDYNPMSSGGSNQGPTSKTLVSKVEERKAAGSAGDLLFASGSGLDPHLSPESAKFQVARVAKARAVDEGIISDMVQKHIESRQLGFLGEERINVLKLNLALDRAHE